jgi:hypothetical protein
LRQRMTKVAPCWRPPRWKVSPSSKMVCAPGAGHVSGCKLQRGLNATLLHAFARSRIRALSCTYLEAECCGPACRP